MLVDPLGLWIGPMIPQGVVDTAAGFGDALTLGGTNWIRELNHTNQWVNPCSLYYTAGQYGGYAVGARLGGAGVEKSIEKVDDYFESAQYTNTVRGHMDKNYCHSFSNSMKGLQDVGNVSK